MKSFTIFIAHPDDELLWCWPVLQDARRIVCASSDEHNPSRAWCRERRLCLEEVGRKIGAEVICLDQDSEFYRMPHRGGELQAFAHQLMGALQEPVFTHNGWGEYGNLDHILCHQIAMATRLEIWSTDIACDAGWLPVYPWFRGSNRPVLDQSMFDEFKAIYDSRGCWTWSFEVPKECGIYRL